MPEPAPKRPPGAPPPRTVAAAQRQLIIAASSALDVLDEENAAAGEAAMERIRASGYAPSVIESEAASLWASYRLRGAAMVIREVSDAARLADRIAAEHAAGARGTIIPGIHLKRAGRATAEAALAGSADAPLGKATTFKGPRPAPPAGATTSVPPLATTPAGEELRRILGPPKAEQALSTRLHGSAARATDEAMLAIRRTIRESQSLDRSGKELIVEVRRAGMGELGQGYRVPQQLEQLRTSGRELAKLEHEPGSPAYIRAKRDWDRRLDSLTRRIYGRDGTSGPALAPQRGDLPDYLQTRGRGGLADNRGAYRELQQILQRGPKGVEAAFHRFTAEKQREHAERILRTEQAAAFRARSLRQYQASGYVLGVIWRLNHAGRRNYSARVGAHKSGPLAGRHCICEMMAGRLLSLEEAASYPRGGHPHCMCTFEPVYRRGGRGGEVTSEELAEMTEEMGI